MCQSNKVSGFNLFLKQWLEDCNEDGYPFDMCEVMFSWYKGMSVPDRQVWVDREESIAEEIEDTLELTFAAYGYYANEWMIQYGRDLRLKDWRDFSEEEKNHYLQMAWLVQDSQDTEVEYDLVLLKEEPIEC